jgi:transcriptional regulator with XRE-family HTH domain
MSAHSQEGSAQWAGIERARYGRIERGEMNLTIDKLLELSAHLNIETYRLLQDVTIYDCMEVQSDDEQG